MTRLLKSASIIALLAGGGVSTQAVAADQPETDQGQVEEIIVTAQRRSESIQKAAVSIAALSAEALQNAGVGTSPSDLTRLVPAAQIQTAASIYPQYSIRGVGNVTYNPYTDATVGVNYDGAPITRVASTVGLFYDLQRVEILKGPQGTLYGRNNTGGAINVLPNHPVIGQLSGDVTLTAANYEMFQATGNINIPLGDQAAIRLSYNGIQRNGFYNNGASDDKGQSARAQFRLEPSDNFDLNIGLDYHHQGGQGPGVTLATTTGLTSVFSLQYANTVLTPYNGDPWQAANSACDGVVGTAHPLDYDDFGFNCIDKGFRDDSFYGINATLNLRTDLGTLTVIPSIRWSDLNSAVVGGYRLATLESSSTKTAEVRFASDPANRFNYILGAFFLHDSADAQFFIDQTAALHLLQNIDTKTESQAFFATARYTITPELRISAGGRYTIDKKTFDGRALAGPGYAFLAYSLNDRQKQWKKFTYRAGLEFDVTDRSMLYLNYERGYKAGGFFFSSPLLGQSYDPEYVNALTLGWRNRLLNGRLVINAEVFKYRYTDQQVSQIEFDPGSFIGQAFTTRNFGEINVNGAEIESRFYITPNTLLTGDVQFLDTEVKKAGLSTTSPLITPQSLIGQDAPFSPHVTATFGIQQTMPLASGASVVASVSGQYRSSMLAGTDYLPFDQVGSSTSGDAYLQYNAPNKRWSVTAFVNNFTNEVIPAYVFATGRYSGAPASPVTAAYRSPRTYGLRISAGF
jgi:iron complex outermembrane recepter protein